MSDEGIIVPTGGAPIPRNEVNVAGGASRDGGAEIHGSVEREKTTTHGDLAAGVEGGISQKKGWTLGGFVKWVWK